MAKAETTSKAQTRKAARASAAAPPVEALGEQPPLTARQEEILNATEATSEVTKGGVVTADPREETDGVKTPIKADFDNPESGLIYDPASTLASPELPGPVTIGVGETAAQHESHVQMSGAAVVAERLEKEKGPDGLPTDLIAREQHERAARAEFQRVDGNGLADRGELAEGKLSDREKAEADS